MLGISIQVVSRTNYDHDWLKIMTKVLTKEAKWGEEVFINITWTVVLFPWSDV